MYLKKGDSERHTVKPFDYRPSLKRFSDQSFSKAAVLVTPRVVSLERFHRDLILNVFLDNSCGVVHLEEIGFEAFFEGGA